MRVIKEKTLKDFGNKHPDSEQPLRAWLMEVKQAEWSSPRDVKVLQALYRETGWCLI